MFVAVFHHQETGHVMSVSPLEVPGSRVFAWGKAVDRFQCAFMSKSCIESKQMDITIAIPNFDQHGVSAARLGLHTSLQGLKQVQGHS